MTDRPNSPQWANARPAQEVCSTCHGDPNLHDMTCDGIAPPPVTAARWTLEQDMADKELLLMRDGALVAHVYDAASGPELIGALNASVQPAAPATELISRITEYLALGGLWNPEEMEHRKVNLLLLDCRAALLAAKPSAWLEQVREVLRQHIEHHDSCVCGEPCLNWAAWVEHILALLAAPETEKL